MWQPEKLDSYMNKQREAARAQDISLSKIIADAKRLPLTSGCAMSDDTHTFDPAHFPVMRAEALQMLAMKDGGTYVDGTFGLGGYTDGMLKAANANVIAIDRDPAAAPRAARFSALFGQRFTLIPGCFGDLGTLLAGAGVAQVDGVVLDLGVSSPQLDEADRGFSFMKDGPLDMRMSGEGQTAAAGREQPWPLIKLADIISELGEERRARRVAEAIVEARATAPIETTLQLAAIVRKRCDRPGQNETVATRSTPQPAPFRPCACM